MNNPMITRGHPRRFLAAATWDFILAGLAGAMWQKLLPFDQPWLHRIPEWAWPAATAVFVFMGVWALWLHFVAKRSH